MLRSAEPRDAEALAAIYNHYVSHTLATFEEVPVPASEMGARVEAVIAAGRPWIVLENARGELEGYACARPWKPRSAYARTVETSIYVRHDGLRRGAGRALYSSLLATLAASDVHVVIGGIALPNEASVALHERLGFRYAGRFREVGFKLGRWVDVGYWELTLGAASPAPSPT